MANVKKLLKACDGNGYDQRRDAAIIMMFIDSGMRLGELTRLTIENVDLRARLAYVTGKGSHVRTVKSVPRQLWTRRPTDPVVPYAGAAS